MPTRGVCQSIRDRISTAEAKGPSAPKSAVSTIIARDQACMGNGRKLTLSAKVTTIGAMEQGTLVGMRKGGVACGTRQADPCTLALSISHRHFLIHVHIVTTKSSRLTFLLDVSLHSYPRKWMPLFASALSTLIPFSRK